jgi:cytoskeletal protein CcmA (bactofilin family)
MNKGQGITFIGAGTRLEGELTLESAALVSGELRGKISSAGQIKIEPEGLIDGELNCHELRVCGTFRGKLRCQKLTIVHGGVVEGEVASNQMEIFDGGQFVGSRTRGPDAVDMPMPANAVLPQEGGKSHLKLVVGLAAAIGIGWLVVAKTPLIANISHSLQTLTASKADAGDDKARAVLDNLIATETSAGLAQGDASQAGIALEASGSLPAAGYFAEDSEAMDAANAMLLEQSFSENSAADADVEADQGLQPQPSESETADSASESTAADSIETGAAANVTGNSALVVDSDASAVGTQDAADVPVNAPVNRM